MYTGNVIGSSSQLYFEPKEEVIPLKKEVERGNPLDSLVNQVRDRKVIFTYEKAQQKDAETIDALMSTEGIYDNKKIVILPHKFRKGAIESAIKNERFFIARNENTIVGYKKLFVLKDTEEQNDTLTNEIRCVNGSLVDAYSLKGAEGAERCRQRIFDPTPQAYEENDLYIYDGADFTKNAFRGKRINPELTNRAFELIKEDAQRLIKEKQAKRLILLYGLTHLNDYDDRGEGKSRTPSILDAFTSFAQTLTGTFPQEVLHYRYKAFMPTFDLDNQECRPRPDSEAIPGYGNVLLVNLQK